MQQNQPIINPQRQQFPRIYKSILNSKAFVFIALLFFFFALNFAYKFFMLQKYQYDVFEVNWGNIPITKNAGIYVLLAYLTSAFIISRIGNRPSDIIHLLFFITPITPMCVIAMHKQIAMEYTFLCLLAFFISYTVSCIRLRIPAIESPWGLITERSFLIICMALGAIIISWSFLKNGLDFLNFNFDDVYEFRRGASKSRGVLLNYLLFNYIGTFLAIAFAITIKKKKWGIALILLLINITIFGLTSNKSVLFIGVFTAGIYIILSTKAPKFYLLFAFSTLIIALTNLYLLNPSFSQLTTLFVRRFMFVPSHANFIYWDFFSQNPYTYWSESKIGLGFVRSPYGISTPLLIADLYSGVDFSRRTVGYASFNTGWLGSGYGNAGTAGVLIYAIFSGIITSYANFLGKLIGNRAATAGLSYFFFAIFTTSSDMPTALLSYGFLALVLIMIFWRQTPRPQTPSILKTLHS